MYTPQFSDLASISVRRLAWAMGTNMTSAVSRIVKLLPTMFDAQAVCARCKDKTKCKDCVFSKEVSAFDKANLTSII